MIASHTHTIRHPQRAYVFDVDGVLTNPVTKRIEQIAILEELLKRLNRDLPITFNTGRSLVFMDPILRYLEDHVASKTALQNLIAVGEKGATWITHTELGTRNEVTDLTVSVPLSLHQQIKQLVETRYSDTMFLDQTKKTMVSIELQTQEHLLECNKTFEDFKTAQLQLTHELKQLLVANDLQAELKVDPTRIATDVESVVVGKALGARRIFTLLQQQNTIPEEYVSFGDSPSDINMHQEFQLLNCQSSFVYVGEVGDLKGMDVARVTVTSQHVDSGTLEFLSAEELPLQD